MKFDINYFFRKKPTDKLKVMYYYYNWGGIFYSFTGIFLSIYFTSTLWKYSNEIRLMLIIIGILMFILSFLTSIALFLSADNCRTILEIRKEDY